MLPSSVAGHLPDLMLDGVNVGPTGLFSTSSAGHLPAAMVKLAVVTCASLLLETMSRPRPLPSSRLCDLDLDLGTMWERMVLPSESEMVGFFSGSNLPTKSKSFSDPKPRDAP